MFVNILALALASSSVPTPNAPVCDVNPQVTGFKATDTLSFTAGNYSRCASIMIPDTPSPPPVLFVAHGSGGSARFFPSARDQQGTNWGEISKKYGFAIVGVEALQFDESGSTWRGGQWLLVQTQTDATGLQCPEDNAEIQYFTALIQQLENYQVPLDTSRLFFTGCSMGSALTVWMAQCWHQKSPAAVTAFGTQSTGLKVKGDGIRLPPDNYDPTYTWGECPTCQYFPAPVKPTTGLKACIRDQTDPSEAEFYKSSLALDAAWKAAGMRSDAVYVTGAHCETGSFDDIAVCMDDGTGRLINTASPSLQPSRPGDTSPPSTPPVIPPSSSPVVGGTGSLAPVIPPSSSPSRPGDTSPPSSSPSRPSDTSPPTLSPTAFVYTECCTPWQIVGYVAGFLICIGVGGCLWVAHKKGWLKPRNQKTNFSAPLKPNVEEPQGTEFPSSKYDELATKPVSV